MFIKWLVGFRCLTGVVIFIVDVIEWVVLYKSIIDYN